MADNVAVTAGSGTTIAADEVTDATLGTVKVQYVKIMDGTLDGTQKVTVKAASTAAATTDPALVVQISPIGEVADDAADSGTGNKIAAKAYAGISGSTMVSAADRIDLAGGIDRILYVRPHCGLEDLQTSDVPVTITSGTSTAVLAAAGSGLKWYLTAITIANTSATAVTVNIRDGTAGAVRWTFPVPASTSGVVCNFQTPLGGFTANTAVAAHVSTGVTSIIVSINGFKSKI